MTISSLFISTTLAVSIHLRSKVSQVPRIPEYCLGKLRGYFTQLCLVPPWTAHHSIILDFEAGEI